MEIRVEAVAQYHCEIGQNPLWDDRRRILFWADTARGRIYSCDPAAEWYEVVYSGDPVGAFTLQEDGRLLLFGAGRISRFLPGTQPEILRTQVDDAMQRFSAAIADPDGRVFAGTLGKDDHSGGLYRIDPDGAVVCLFKGTGCAAGMGFSPELDRFYWTCSTTGRIFQFDYDRASGELSRRTEIVAALPDEGTPGGMAVDREGTIWSARWDGAAVWKHSTTGKRLGWVDLPVGRVSSVAFGGRQGDELFAATGGGREGSPDPDGSVYRIRGLGVRGQPLSRSRILM